MQDNLRELLKVAFALKNEPFRQEGEKILAIYNFASKGRAKIILPDSRQLIYGEIAALGISVFLIALWSSFLAFQWLLFCVIIIQVPMLISLLLHAQVDTSDNGRRLSNIFGSRTVDSQRAQDLFLAGIKGNEILLGVYAEHRKANRFLYLSFALLITLIIAAIQFLMLYEFVKLRLATVPVFILMILCFVVFFAWMRSVHLRDCMLSSMGSRLFSWMVCSQKEIDSEFSFLGNKKINSSKSKRGKGCFLTILGAGGFLFIEILFGVEALVGEKEVVYSIGLLLVGEFVIIIGLIREIILNLRQHMEMGKECLKRGDIFFPSYIQHELNN